MHPVIDRFLERPLKQKLVASGLFFAFLIFVFYEYIYSAQYDQYVKLQEDVEKLNSQVQNEGRLARNLGKYREEVQSLEVKLKFALQELPDKRQIPDLLNSVSNLARDAGLEVSIFKPKGEVFREFYAEFPVSISVEGTYHQVATFFDEVARMSRIVNIGDIFLRDPKLSDAESRIKTDCVATTFRYLDESERTQSTDQDSSKRRRKK